MEMDISKKLAPYGFMLAAAAFTGQAQAAIVDIDSLLIDTESTIDLDYGGTLYSFTTTDTFSILMGDYQTNIVTLSEDTSGSTAVIYSIVESGDAPSGTVDDLEGTIDVDFSAINASFELVTTTSGGGPGGTSTTTENIDVAMWVSGSTVVNTNLYDPSTSLFALGWTTLLDTTTVVTLCFGGGGSCDGTTDTVDATLAGTVVLSAVPVPAAVWLFGSGLLGLAGIAKRKNKKIG